MRQKTETKRKKWYIWVLIILIALPAYYFPAYVYSARTKPYGRYADAAPVWFQYVSVIHKWDKPSYSDGVHFPRILPQGDATLVLRANKTGRLVWPEKGIDVSFKYDYDHADSEHAYFVIEGEKSMRFDFVNLFNQINFYLNDNETLDFQRDALWTPK